MEDIQNICQQAKVWLPLLIQNESTLQDAKRSIQEKKRVGLGLAIKWKTLNKLNQILFYGTLKTKMFYHAAQKIKSAAT